MSEQANVLVIDNDKDLINLYRQSFLNLNPKYKVNVTSSCDEAINGERIEYLFVIINIKLYAKRQNRVLSMPEKVKLLKRFFRRSKLVISMSSGNYDAIYQSLAHFFPDAIIIKEDLFLRNCFSPLVNSLSGGTPYYSETVLKFIKQTYGKNPKVDHIDIAILKELDKGTKMKDIPNIVGISLSAVEKRKQHLKKQLNVQGSDKNLINAAKRIGIL